MRFSFVGAILVALSLLACAGPKASDSGTGTAGPLVKTPKPSEPSPSATPRTPESSENTLIETPEYTGVLFSETGALQFGYVFGGASPAFWGPSFDDVAKAEKCIRQFLVSAQDNPDLHFYERDNAVYILENLKKFRRQYVGIVVDGEKRIWCNLFLLVDEFPDWHRTPVYVLDGGNQFWDIEYVLDRDECINFAVHGDA